ncbi:MULTISPECIES: NUDIX domain-containing protein [Clostridium]|uniref:NUDIX domain-containing protein n=1 Tax=Clostridium cibarium TaxID=2762247 RepID=A0ABR8PWH9_9CLOT|nr:MULTISPECIES: NUDIX domain-containing protein [Clostridium]MBD7912531.1 NUDIX domain-containing protein [Clostridium cibarium]
MLKINFHKLNTIKEDKLLFAVIMAKFNGRWIYVKHKKRQTWEIPGGHREPNENIDDTASRELFEETGATEFNLTPVCIYSVESDQAGDYTESLGALFYSGVKALGKLPDFEINEIKLFDDIPNELTYPLIQPFLHKKVLEFINKV